MGGVALSSIGATSACLAHPNPIASPNASRPPRIAIVGAGLAGLHCAYRLRQVGLRATLFEASLRVGGRVYSKPMASSGQVAELGGEFIDTGHLTMHALAREFALPLDDRRELARDLTGEIYYLSGKRVAEATIVEQFRDLVPIIGKQITRIEQDGDRALAQRLDRTSLRVWLNEHVPLPSHAELYQLLEVAYRGEYGRELEQQSCLNLLYLIGWDPPEPFRIFGESDERFHLHAGNAQLCEALARQLPGQIRTDSALLRIAGSAKGPYRLSLVGSTGETTDFVADHVVMSLPFTKLRQVDLRELELSHKKRRIINELGYGTNAKLIGAFRERLWQTRYQANGSLTTTLGLEQCWDTSLGQDGNAGILTNFRGGKAGVAVGAGNAEEHFRDAIRDLEQVFSGIRGSYVEGSALRMHWPSHPHTLGSYACYAPGQWSFWSLEGQSEGHVHFCGEHTSVDFQGYMEGAAETGSRAAGEILAELGITPAPQHRTILELYARLPDATTTGRLCPNERRGALAARTVALLTALV